MFQVVPPPPCGRLGATGRPTLSQSPRERGGIGAERDHVGDLAPRPQIFGGGGPPDTGSEPLKGEGGGSTGSRVAPGPTRTQRFAGYIAAFPILADPVDVKKGDQLCENESQPSIRSDKVDPPMGS